MNLAGLLPHQERIVPQLVNSLRTHRVALDASEMGTGKSYSAAAAIRELDEPTLIIHPKSLYTSWQRAMEHIGVEASQSHYDILRTGKTDFGKWAKKVGNFWQPCAGRDRGSVFRYAGGIRLLVFDEAHKCNGWGTQNSKMLKAAKSQGIPTLALTGTPAQKPGDLDALGYLLGLHAPHMPVTLRTLNNDAPALPSFWQWCMRKGCRPGLFGGLDFRGTTEERAKIMVKVREEIGDRMVRVTEDEIEGLPEHHIIPQLFDIADPARLEKLYAEMRDAVSALRERKLADKDPNHPLTRLLRAKQEMELLKAPIFVERTDSLVAEGRHVCIFVSHRQTIEAIENRLKYLRVATLHGDTKDRAAVVDQFQADELDAIVCQIDTGGLGISFHDLHGNFPRASLISPGFSALMLAQALKRTHRVGAKTRCISYIVFAAHTSDERVHANLTKRLNNGQAFVDGDLTPDNLGLIDTV